MTLSTEFYPDLRHGAMPMGQFMNCSYGMNGCSNFLAESYS